MYFSINNIWYDLNKYITDTTEFYVKNSFGNVYLESKNIWQERNYGNFTMHIFEKEAAQ